MWPREREGVGEVRKNNTSNMTNLALEGFFWSPRQSQTSVAKQSV